MSVADSFAKIGDQMQQLALDYSSKAMKLAIPFEHSDDRAKIERLSETSQVYQSLADAFRRQAEILRGERKEADMLPSDLRMAHVEALQEARDAVQRLWADRRDGRLIIQMLNQMIDRESQKNYPFVPGPSDCEVFNFPCGCIYRVDRAEDGWHIAYDPFICAKDKASGVDGWRREALVLAVKKMRS